MENGFVIEDGLLKKYLGPGGDVTVPEGVTSIGREAFRGCGTLAGVTLPPGVTAIGPAAFSGCTGLRRVTIPASVTSIAGWAFLGCSNLAVIALPEGLTSIEWELFKDCTCLTDVTIPESVTAIGDWAFKNCVSLKNVTIPSKVTLIGKEAFAKCGALKSAVVPDGVRTIGEAAFSSCPELCITLPPHLADNAEFFLSLNGRVEEKLTIRTPDISRLPESLRMRAAIGFAEERPDLSTERAAGHLQYIGDHLPRFAAEAVRRTELYLRLCADRRIPMEDLDIFLAAAQACGNPAAIAATLEYKETGLSPEEKDRLAKQKEKDEDTVFERMLARAGRLGIEGCTVFAEGNFKRFKDREQLERFVARCGGELQPALSPETDFFVTDKECSGSRNLRRAMELGIEVLSEQQFLQKASESDPEYPSTPQG